MKPFLTKTGELVNQSSVTYIVLQFKDLFGSWKKENYEEKLFFVVNKNKNREKNKDKQIG